MLLGSNTAGCTVSEYHLICPFDVSYMQEAQKILCVPVPSQRQSECSHIHQVQKCSKLRSKVVVVIRAEAAPAAAPLRGIR